MNFQGQNFPDREEYKAKILRWGTGLAYSRNSRRARLHRTVEAVIRNLEDFSPPLFSGYRGKLIEGLSKGLVI